MRHDGLVGDVNDDRAIDVTDLLAIVEYYGAACTGPCAVDHDGNGVVGVYDLLGMLGNWSE